MGEETARLRREIDQTRVDLTRDVDMIADKTSPSRIVERRVERTRRGLTGIKDRIMGNGGDASSSGGSGQASDDPYGAGYYGPTYTGGGQYEYTGGTGYPTDAPGAGDRLRGAGSTVADKAQGAMASVQGTASDAAHRASDAAHGTVSTARRQADGNPLAAGVVAFGIGWLVSSLLPPSEAEVQAARRAQEKAKASGGPLVDQAKQAAAEIGENLKGSAQEAVEQVKGHAQDAAQTVKAEGTSAAQTVKEEGTSAAQTVKEDARSTATSGSGTTGTGTASGTTGTVPSTAPGATLGATVGSTADDTGTTAAGASTEPGHRGL